MNIKVINDAEQAQNQQVTTEVTPAENTHIARICSSQSIASTKATPCTVQQMLELMSQPLTKQICDALATINNMQWYDNQTLATITAQDWAKALISKAEKRDKANKDLTPSDPKYVHYTSHEQVFRALKEGLPVFYFHSKKFKGDRRSSANAIPNMLYMLDIDHVNKPREIAKWAHIDNADFCKKNHIAYVGVTPSAHGLRVVAVLPTGKNIEQAQTDLAYFIAKQVLSATSITINEQDIHTWLYGNDGTQGHFDTHCTDLARASFAPHIDNIIYIDTNLLEFPSQEEADRADNQAVTNQNNTHTTYTTSTTNTNLPTTTTTITNSFPTTFITDNGNTIDYKVIAEKVCEVKSNNRPIQEGVRNSILYKTALALRPICGDNPAWISSILPTYGLSAEEVQDICKNARKYGSQNLTFQLDLQKAIAMAEMETTPGTQQEVVKVQAQEVTQEDIDPNQLPLPPLPEPLNTLCKYVPAKYRWALIMACLPQIGALLSGIRFKIGQKTHALAFMTLVFGPQRSFKGTILDAPIAAIQTPIREEDEVKNKERDEYIEAKERRKDGEELPANPHSEPRIVSMAAGESAILDALLDNPGKAVVGYTPEIDNLIAGLNKGTWCLPKSAFKDAFDLALRGTTYKSRTKKQVPFFYNLTATGTDGALPSILDDNDVEGGLATRLILVKFPFSKFQPAPEISDYSKEDYERIVHICRQFNDIEEGMYRCECLHDWQKEWNEQKRLLAEKTDNEALYLHYIRASIIGMRAGYYAAKYYGIAQKEGEQAIRQTKEVKRLQKLTVQFAEAVAEYTLRSQLLLVGDRTAQISKKSSITTSVSAQNYAKQTGIKAVLAQLPDEFTAADVQRVRLQMGYSDGASRDRTRMIDRGLVEKLRDENGNETGIYRKIK